MGGMKQVLQNIDSGKTEVRAVPAPLCGPGEVLIANRASLVSAGTERMLVEFSRKSLLGKARERPDQVRRVLQKMRDEGVLETVRQVRARLADPLALGYSSAGVVLEVGTGVEGLRPGDRVASNGPHAEIVAVPQRLVARIPGDVAWDRACYAVVGAIALQGIRLANVGMGDRVVVIGLGLIGQLAVRLLVGAGCRVFATDLDEDRRDLAAGAVAVSGDDLAAAVNDATDGHGADAVLLAAATDSNGPLELAADVARRKARLVCVGAVGMDVPRRAFYPKELELVVSCSYGPGRYDPLYEDRGVDYPYGHVRWTEQRNIAAVLEQMEAGRLDVASMTSHTFAIEDGESAYDLFEGDGDGSLGIVLTYAAEEPDSADRVVELRSGGGTGDVSLGLVGAGNYASLVLLPALQRQDGIRYRAIASAGGVSAVSRGERNDFEIACSDAEALFADADVNTVVVATRHGNHADLAARAMAAGKHCWVEKPLAVNPEQLEAVEAAVASAGADRPVLAVGFNRRWAPATEAVREVFDGVDEPLSMVYRFHGGPLPQDHWTRDPDEGGGRLVGEACHAFDLVSFLAGAPITRVFAESVRPGGGSAFAEDRAMVSLRFADGSVASVAYLSAGDKAHPKERLEVFGGGRVAVLDDFRSVHVTRDGKSKTHKLGAREKGQGAALAAFLRCIREGSGDPVDVSSLFNTTRATFAAMESLRTGMPVEL
jgi:predicted dehydrogenase/threonine dehydrogenase-like Zn-dependent dehydrogenase